MNRPAIDDLLGSILSTWYESVAEWMPPGQLSAATCTSCRASLLGSVVELAAWPHDLMHQLSASLDSAIETIAETQPVDAARDHVQAHLMGQTSDLMDVLNECVTPRLDDWISAQAMSLTPHLRG